MPFNLEKFFEDIFEPDDGEVVTVMYDPTSRQRYRQQSLARTSSNGRGLARKG